MSEELPTRMRDKQGNAWHWSESQNDWVPSGEEVSPAMGVVLGTGRRLQNVGQGIRELVGADPASQSDELVSESLSSQAPISSVVGDVLPDVAAGFGVGTVGRGASMVQRMRAAGQVAGLEGALGAAAPGTASERLERGMTGAAFGAGGFAVGEMSMRIVNNIRRSRQASLAEPGGAQPAAGLADPASPAAANQNLPPGFDGSAGAARADDVDIFNEPVPGEFDAKRGFMGLGDEEAGASIAELEAMEKGLQMGVTFEPGVGTGNIATRQAFASGKRFPVFSDIAHSEITSKNTALYQDKALKALGETGGEFDHNTLSKIDGRIDDTLSNIYERTPGLSTSKIINPARQPTEEALDIGMALNRVADDHISSARYQGKKDPAVATVRQAAELIESQSKGGKLSTQSYAKLRSELRNEHRKYTSGQAPNHNAAETMNEAIEQLDEWFGASVSKEDSDLFHKTMQQYRLLQSIDKPNALSNALALRPGNIASNLRKNYRVEYARNNRFFQGGEQKSVKELDPAISEFFDATKVFTAFPDLVGDSGTATNAFLQNALGDIPGTAAALAARPAFRAGIKMLQPDLNDVRQQLARQRQLIDAVPDQ